jgi:hypothetical protein
VIQGIAGQVAVKGRNTGNVLEGVDDVEEVEKGEAVIAERLETTIALWRSTVLRPRRQEGQLCGSND